MGWKYSQPMCVPQTKSRLPVCSYFAVAIAAIHWSALTGLEGDSSCLAAISAYSREHFTSGCIAIIAMSIAVAVKSILLCFPCLTAFGATLWLVRVASRLELLLFLNVKGKTFRAIETFECLVLKTHWMTSSLGYLVRARAIQYLM